MRYNRCCRERHAAFPPPPPRVGQAASLSCQADKLAACPATFLVKTRNTCWRGVRGEGQKRKKHDRYLEDGRRRAAVGNTGGRGEGSADEGRRHFGLRFQPRRAGFYHPRTHSGRRRD